MTPRRTTEGQAIFTAGIVVLGCLIGLLAVSNDSYWIDESSTVHKAIMPTLAGWWERLRGEATSNMQLPLYLLYAWGWDKVFGHHEWVLRAANVPWFVLGVVALGWTAGTRPSRTLMTLSAMLSAFAWFYLNEARPYAMQFGAACVVFAALVRLARAEPGAAEARTWAWVLASSAVVLAASGMLAMIWLAGGLMAGFLARPWTETRRLLVDHRGAWTAMLFLLLMVGVYYLWTMTLGARATVIARTDLRSVFLTAYEMLGLTGLGPGRLAIRNEGLVAFKPYVGALAVYAGLVVVAGVAGWRRVRAESSRRALAWTILGSGGVLVFLLAVGLTSRFRVLGRHCMPLLPPVLYVLGLGLTAAWRRRGWLGKASVTAFALMSLASCLMLRFDARHAKDDYRGAAVLAKQALQKGERIWWNADEQSALIYGVPMVSGRDVPGSMVLIEPPAPGFESGLTLPDLVILSKPDVYDGNGRLQGFLSREGYHKTGSLVAFTLWRRRPEP